MNADHDAGCVFCRIVSGEAPAHRIWEDADHLAFLSIFPNTEGFSVVIPKTHRTSYVVDLEPSEYAALHLAARETARRLDAAFADVARTGIMYEGYGVDHAHAKLFPMHGTAGNAGENWREVVSPIEGYFDRYQGYLSSHDHTRADDAWLAEVAERVRKAAPCARLLRAPRTQGRDGPQKDRPAVVVPGLVVAVVVHSGPPSRYGGRITGCGRPGWPNRLQQP